MLNKITWPHEVVYTLAGMPISYQDMSVPQFVYGYLLVMDSEKADIRDQLASHLKCLMSDAQLYVWDRRRAFHGVWLNQLEQGRCTGFGEGAQMQLCKHSSGIWPIHPLPSRPHPRSGRGPVKSGTKACRAFNHCPRCLEVMVRLMSDLCSFHLLTSEGPASAFPRDL